MAKRVLAPEDSEFKYPLPGMAMHTSDFSVEEAEMGKSLGLDGHLASGWGRIIKISNNRVEHLLGIRFHSVGVRKHTHMNTQTCCALDSIL